MNIMTIRLKTLNIQNIINIILFALLLSDNYILAPKYSDNCNIADRIF